MGIPMVAHLLVHPFIGLSFHDALIAAAPSPVPAPKTPNISFSILNGVFLGALPSAGPVGPAEPVHGWGGIPLVGRTNDAGMVLPHVAFAQFDLMQPLTILLGGSESLLGASSVKIPVRNLIWGEETQDTACCWPMPFIPLSINFGCNDPLFVPFDQVIAPNTILVGISWADILKLVIDLVIAVIIEGIMMAGGKVAKKGFKKAGKKLGKKSGAKLARETAKEAADEAGEKAVKKGARKASREAVEEGATQAGDEAAERVARKQALAEGLRKQRAKVTGAPVPPPKPKRFLEPARERARRQAQKEFREKSAKEVSEAAREKFMKESAERVRKEAAEKARKEALDAPMGDTMRKTFSESGKWRQGLNEAKGMYAEKLGTEEIMKAVFKKPTGMAKGYVDGQAENLS